MGVGRCCAPRKSRQKLGEILLVDATPQNPQPCKLLWRSVEKCRRYPRSRICGPRKSGPKFTLNFRGCYPLRPPIVPNFIEIGQTSLEIVVGREKNLHTHTHTRHPDWLRRFAADSLSSSDEMRWRQLLQFERCF